jgi:diketogulonate reductase-like aldo/keto reductase
MKHISIGGLDVSRIGLGAMSMSGYYNIGESSDAESIRTIHRALDLGVTHLDTAEIFSRAGHEVDTAGLPPRIRRGSGRAAGARATESRPRHTRR